MATVVEKTIGTGGDYATPQAWFDAAPSDLTAVDQIWRGKVKNQEFVSSGNVLTLQGKTVDATRYFELTTDAGASFVEHASAATNPLRYDSSKGAAFRTTDEYAVCVLNRLLHTRISKLQMRVDASSPYAQPPLAVRDNGFGVIIDKCIIDGGSDNQYLPGALWLEFGGTIRNSAVIQRSASAGAYIAEMNNAAVAENVLFVATGAILNNGLSMKYQAGVLTKVYVGGVVNPREGTVPTKTNCFTNATAADWTTVPFSTATFESVALAAPDFRPKAGSPLIAPAVFGAYTYQAAPSAGPVLQNPTGTATSSTAATGTVSTDTGGGILYFLTLAAASAVPSAATIKASGGSQAVTATGTRTVSITSLTAGTAYRTHYMQENGSGVQSNVASSPAYSTPAPDGIVPTFPSGSAITPGAVTSSSLAGSYPAASDNVGVAGYEVSSDGGATWINNGTGLNFLFNGLPSSTTRIVMARAFDATGNRSAALQLSMTTSAGVVGAFTTAKLGNNTGTGLLAGTAVFWEWHQGGRIGSAPTSVTRGNGALAANGTLTATGLPAGAGILYVAKRGATYAQDDVYAQPGTVA